MVNPQRKRNLDADTLEHMVRASRMELSPAVQAELLPLVQGTYELIDLLDDVELGDTFPATAFDTTRP